MKIKTNQSNKSEKTLAGHMLELKLKQLQQISDAAFVLMHREVEKKMHFW